MSRITKELICICFSAVILLLTIATITSAKECNGDCAVWISETQTIHINSLLIPLYNDEGERVGEVYLWAGFKLVPSPPGEKGLFFELCPDYGYSEQADDNCSAWNPETQTIHISSLLIGEVCYWVDLVFRSDLSGEHVVFQFTDWCHSELDIFGPAFNAVDGFGDWRKNIEDTSFSNLAMVASEEVKPIELAIKDKEKIVFAAKHGMKSLVVITAIFFDYELKDENGQIKIKKFWLREDYRERWRVYANILDPQDIFGKMLLGSSCADKIWGFYILDEPYSAAIQISMPLKQMREMLNEVMAVIKKRFPDSLTVNVIGVTREDLEQASFFGWPVSEDDWKEYAFPNFDVVGVYCYWTQFKIFYPGSTLGDFKRVWREKYMKNANQFLLPWQKIVLVPGTFGFLHSDMPTEEDFLDLAKFYWDTAKTDPRITAIVPFLWPSSGGLIGLRDLPPEVFFKWQEIGKKIKNH